MTTLHIIGNGFDLHHGIASLYSDFKEYAWRHSGLDVYWIGLLETCYPTKNKENGELELWCDLEQALGNIDFQNAFDESTEDIELEEDHEIRFQAQMEDAPKYHMEMMFEAFHGIFEEWVDQIDIDGQPVALPHFDRKGMFLSFNYTETLETLYEIPKTQINYIHGRRNCNQRLVVGHINNLNGNEFLSEDPMIYEYEAYDNIAEVVNEQQKNISEIISDNAKYWKSLTNIDKIVIYGHSLSDIDLDYFIEIANHVTSDVHWFFSIYYNNPQERDKEILRVKNFISKLKIDISNCQTFTM